MIAFLTSAATSAAIEYFISGVTAAISLYCGVRTPHNKRKKK